MHEASLMFQSIAFCKLAEGVVVDLDCWALEYIYQFLESYPALQKMKKIYQKVEKLW